MQVTLSSLFLHCLLARMLHSYLRVRNYEHRAVLARVTGFEPAEWNEPFLVLETSVPRRLHRTPIF